MVRWHDLQNTYKTLVFSQKDARKADIHIRSNIFMVHTIQRRSDQDNVFLKRTTRTVVVAIDRLQ